MTGAWDIGLGHEVLVECRCSIQFFWLKSNVINVLCVLFILISEMISIFYFMQNLVEHQNCTDYYNDTFIITILGFTKDLLTLRVASTK